MSKYQPLTEFLSASGGRQLRLTFSDLEKVLGFQLPPSKQYQAWWSNNPTNNVMTKAWLAAGYKTEQVDVAGERVTFVKADPGRDKLPAAKLSQRDAAAADSETETDGSSGEQPPQADTPGRHPAWGALKGMFTIPAGVDLTEPAFTEWKELYGEDD